MTSYSFENIEIFRKYLTQPEVVRLVIDIKNWQQCLLACPCKQMVLFLLQIRIIWQEMGGKRNNHQDKQREKYGNIEIYWGRGTSNLEQFSFHKQRNGLSNSCFSEFQISVRQRWSLMIWNQSLKMEGNEMRKCSLYLQTNIKCFCTTIINGRQRQTTCELWEIDICKTCGDYR